ncbi:hypothetical protein ZWY2020_059987 [Hordeum vulgare]|nr:hypothetical protein ZWY2020_059987 [Hordeum vulgare]
MVVERLAVTFVVVVVVAAATSSMPVLVMGDEKAPSCPDEYSKLCGKDSACTTMVDTACRTDADSVELIKGLFAKLAMVGGDNYDFASTAWPWGHEALRSAVDAWGLPRQQDGRKVCRRALHQGPQRGMQRPDLHRRGLHPMLPNSHQILLHQGHPHPQESHNAKHGLLRRLLRSEEAK